MLHIGKNNTTTCTINCRPQQCRLFYSIAILIAWPSRTLFLLKILIIKTSSYSKHITMVTKEIKPKTSLYAYKHKESITKEAIS